MSGMIFKKSLDQAIEYATVAAHFKKQAFLVVAIVALIYFIREAKIYPIIFLSITILLANIIIGIKKGANFSRLLDFELLKSELLGDCSLPSKFVAAASILVFLFVAYFAIARMLETTHRRLLDSLNLLAIEVIITTIVSVFQLAFPDLKVAIAFNMISQIIILMISLISFIFLLVAIFLPLVLHLNSKNAIKNAEILKYLALIIKNKITFVFFDGFPKNEEIDRKREIREEGKRQVREEAHNIQLAAFNLLKNEEKYREISLVIFIFTPRFLFKECRNLYLEYQKFIQESKNLVTDMWPKLLELNKKIDNINHENNTNLKPKAEYITDGTINGYLLNEKNNLVAIKGANQRLYYIEGVGQLLSKIQIN